MSTQNVENILSATQQMAIIEAQLPGDVFAAVSGTIKTSPVASFADVASAKVAEYAKLGYTVAVTLTSPDPVVAPTEPAAPTEVTP